MFVELALFCFLGTAAGMLTGLIPGLHPNTMALGISFLLGVIGDPLLLAAFVASMAVSNSIADFIPSILFGAPDAGNELAALPGHRLLQEGRAYEAIKLTVKGGLGSVIIASALFPFLALLMPFAYSGILAYMHLILAAFSIYIILDSSSKKTVKALAVFIASGSVGLMAASIPVSHPLTLFPMLAGFFGMPLLLLSRSTRMPEQNFEEDEIPRKDQSISAISGSMAGLISGFLPGVGSSVMAGLFSRNSGKDGRRKFLITIGGITSSNILLSFFSLMLIERARSGTAASIGQIMDIDLFTILIIISASLASAGAASVLTLTASKTIIRKAVNFNYSSLGKATAGLIVATTAALTGFPGLAILFTTTSIGLAANLSKTKRTAMLGSLLLPVAVFYTSI